MENMKFNLVEWLKGKKTYFIAIALGIVTSVQYLGWIDAETALTLSGFLVAGGLATLRAGVESVK